MPAVESDEELEGIEELVEKKEARPLLGIVPHEKLKGEKLVFMEKTQSDHEDKGPCPSAQAGRLRIEKKGLPEIQVFEPFISRQEVGRIGGNGRGSRTEPFPHTDSRMETVP